MKLKDIVTDKKKFFKSSIQFFKLVFPFTVQLLTPHMACSSTNILPTVTYTAHC